MYKDFYGFIRYPFALTADPQFLYPSDNYQDCLFYLLSGLAQDQGCLVLTGEIGTGKTFLLHTLVQRLDENIQVAFLVHSKLNTHELFQYISQELSLNITGQSKAELLLHFKECLLTHAVVYPTTADNSFAPTTGDNAPNSTCCGGGTALVSPLFYSPLAVLGLAWLFVLLHVTGAKPGLPAPPIAA